MKEQNHFEVRLLSRQVLGLWGSQYIITVHSYRKAI